MRIDPGLRIGVDLGGTKIEAVALGPDGAQLFRRRRPTPRGAYLPIMEAIAGLVREAEAALGARASVGVGIPGTISPATGPNPPIASRCARDAVMP